MALRSLALFCMAIGTIFLSSITPARADSHVAAVQCDAADNRLLVRFGMNGGYYSEIPKDIEDNWEHRPVTEVDPGGKDVCQFKNGRKISLYLITTVETNGEGGGNVSVFFSMRVGTRYIYHEREVYPGIISYRYDISAIAYDGNALRECSPHETEDGNGAISSAAPECHDASLRLAAGDHLTDQEKSTLREEDENPGAYDLR